AYRECAPCAPRAPCCSAARQGRHHRPNSAAARASGRDNSVRPRQSAGCPGLSWFAPPVVVGKLRLGYRAVAVHHHTLVASFPPERLAAEELGIGLGEPDIAQHPVVELGELVAVVSAPAPFAKRRQSPTR